MMGPDFRRLLVDGTVWLWMIKAELMPGVLNFLYSASYQCLKNVKEASKLFFILRRQDLSLNWEREQILGLCIGF